MVTQVLTLQDRYIDKTKIKVKDISEYTNTAPDRRDSFARYLQAAKFDKNGNLTYATDIDNTHPLTTIEWLFNYIGDSPYRFFYFNVPLWDNATNYQIEVITDNVITQFADIIYHTDSNTYYKAIQANSNIQPTVTANWENYWIVYNIANIAEYVKTTQMIVTIYDDIVAYAYETCIRKKIEKQTDKELCGPCTDVEEFMNTLHAEFMLNSAKSAVWAQKPQMAALILEQASKKFCSC